MGQSRPVFVYLRPFLITISISIDGVLGIWTHGRRMVDADITTEQWLKLFLVCSIGWIRSTFIWLIPDSYFYGWRRIVSNWQNLKCFKRLWSAKKVWFSLHGFWCFVTPGLRRLEKNNANLKAYSEELLLFCCDLQLVQGVAINWNIFPLFATYCVSHWLQQNWRGPNRP